MGGWGLRDRGARSADLDVGKESRQRVLFLTWKAVTSSELVVSCCTHVIPEQEPCYSSLYHFNFIFLDVSKVYMCFCLDRAPSGTW